jgi:hypothetical protein
MRRSKIDFKIFMCIFMENCDPVALFKPQIPQSLRQAPDPCGKFPIVHSQFTADNRLLFRVETHRFGKQFIQRHIFSPYPIYLASNIFFK